MSIFASQTSAPRTLARHFGTKSHETSETLIMKARCLPEKSGCTTELGKEPLNLLQAYSALHHTWQTNKKKRLQMFETLRVDGEWISKSMVIQNNTKCDTSKIEFWFFTLLARGIARLSPSPVFQSAFNIWAKFVVALAPMIDSSTDKPLVFAVKKRKEPTGDHLLQ